jgi:hypothetical protein
VAVGGIAVGAVVCAGTLAAVDRAFTGSPAPFVPAGNAVLIAVGVATVAVVPIMAAFRRLCDRALGD